jgi:hypothetical protein
MVSDTQLQIDYARSDIPSHLALNALSARPKETKDHALCIRWNWCALTGTVFPITHLLAMAYFDEAQPKDPRTV